MAMIGHKARHIRSPGISQRKIASPVAEEGAPNGIPEAVRHFEHLSLSMAARGTLGEGN
jgi:hypothetical protein